MKQADRFKGLEDWQVVCQFLPAGWQEAARTYGALRRARGIRDPTVLLRTLLVHLAEGCSLQETAIRVREAGWCSVSPVAVFKRLRAAEQWLRWLAEQLWRRESGPAIKTAYRARAVDAATVQEPGSTGTHWRVHYVINLANLQCDYFELTDVKGGETFRRIPVAPNDLMLGDRAYGTPPGVAHVVAAGGAVLVRINLKSLPLYTESGRKVSLLRRLRTLRLGDVREWGAWVHAADNDIAGRLAAVKLGQQAAEAARARLRRTANRKQRALSEEALEAAGYVFVWTTVPSPVSTPTEIMECYRVRWQIELAFKRMKSIMGLGQLPKTSDASARAWLHGKLFIAMLIERLLEEAESFSPWGYRLDAPQESVARDAVYVPRAGIRRVPPSGSAPNTGTLV